MLLRRVPPLLQVKDGTGYPYATHTNIPVLPAVIVALSDMIAMNVAVGILIMINCYKCSIFIQLSIHMKKFVIIC